MAIKLVVFDMAGTTVADERAVAIAFQKAFGTYGFTVEEEEVKPLMGYKKTLAIQTVLENRHIQWDQALIEDIHDEFVGEMIDHYEYSPEVKALSGAEDTFLELKENAVKVALNTGFPREVADTILQRLQWVEKGLIDDIIASDEVELGRPASFMIWELMKRNGITDSREVAKIGDTGVDIEEGRQSNCGLVIAVTTGAFTRPQLELLEPDLVIDHLSGVATIILRHG